MGILFWILLVLAVVCLGDIVYLVYVMFGSSGPTITEYLCYFFGVIALPSLFFGVVFHLAEFGYLCWFVGHYFL